MDTATLHDWSAAMATAKLARFPNGRTLAPWAYRRPDGSVVTATGSVVALLAIDGHHTADEPVPYDRITRTADERWRRPTGKRVDELFGRPATSVGTGPVVAWQQLAGVPFDPGGPPEIDCPECNGTGETECPHCYQDMDCSECCGTGRVEGDGEEWPATRALKVSDRLFNLAYLAPLLAILPDGPLSASTALMADGGCLLLLVGEGWRLVCISFVAGKEPEEGWTVLDLPGATP